MWAGLMIGISIAFSGLLINFVLNNDFGMFFMPMTFALVAFFSLLSGIIKSASIYSHVLHSRLTYSKSLLLSWLVLFFSSIILTVIAYVFYKFYPDFMVDWINKYLQFINQAIQGGSSEDVFTESKNILLQSKSQYASLSPIMLALSVTQSYFFISSILIVFASLFIRGNYKK